MKHSVRIDGTTEDGQRLAVVVPLVLYAMGSIFLVLALGLFLLGQSAAADARLLAAEGVAVKAEVVNRTVTESRTRDMDDRLRTSTSYRVDLRFTAASGEEVRVDHPVSRGQFDELEVGATVTIYHVPSRPTLISFQKGDPDAGVGVFGVVAVIFGLVGLGIVALGRRLRRRMLAA